MRLFSRKLKNEAERSSLSDPEAWLVETLGVDRQRVTPETAVQTVACYACIRVISEQIAMLPLNLYRRKSDGGRIKCRDHPLHRILNEQPNPYMTAFAFWRMMLVNLTLCGGGYAEIERDRQTREPRRLWPIPAKYVEKKRHPGGEPYWKVKIPVFGENGSVTGYETRVLPFGYMLELPGLTLDGLSAFAPAELLRGALSLSMAAEKYSTEYFTNGSHPSGTIEYPGRLKGERLDDYRRNVAAAYSGLGNQHRVMLLEEGMKFNRIAAPANEGQMFESRKFQVVEVARFFNVPPNKIMDLERATYNNMEEMNAQFADDTLGPYLTSIRQAAMGGLLFDFQREDGLYLEHDLNSLMKGKLLDRYQAYQVARMNAILNTNEIRERENLDNIGPAGDVFYMPANMLPLEGGQ